MKINIFRTKELFITFIILITALLQVGCSTDSVLEDQFNGPANTVIDSLQNKGTVSVVTMFPPSAMAGDSITLTGFGFEEKAGQTLKVFFGGNKEGVANIISSTEIHVAVPDSLFKGKVKVWLDQNNFAYSSISFDIIPLKINSFFPLSAPVGTSITISGSGFKPGIKVYFNGNIEAVSQLVNTNTITAIVPVTGNVNGKITVWQSSTKSTISDVPFVLESVPLTITSITPIKVKSGDQITIIGTGYKPDEVNKVLFGSSKIEGVVSVYSTTQMLVTVPKGDVNGPITIWQRADRTVTSSISLKQVLAPAINALSDSIAAPGSSITINGVDFSTAPSDVKVMFGGTQGNITSVTSTAIVVQVPALAAKDVRTTISVLNIDDNKASNIRNFIAWNAAKQFKDNFDRDNTDWDSSTTSPSPIGLNWATLSGNAQINNNIIVTKFDNKMVYKNPLAVLGAGKKFNFAIDVFVNHPSAPTVFGGLMFNVQSDGQAFQLIRFSPAGLVQALYTTNDGGSWPGVFMSNNYSMPGQVWYHIELSSEGADVIHLKILKPDGSPVIDTNITMSGAITGGKFGFWTFGDLGQYDNFNLLLE